VYPVVARALHPVLPRHAPLRPAVRPPRPVQVLLRGARRVMCSADIEPAAETALAELLADIAAALAAERGADHVSVRIGPVDFGGAA